MCYGIKSAAALALWNFGFKILYHRLASSIIECKLLPLTSTTKSASDLSGAFFVVMLDQESFERSVEKKSRKHQTHLLTSKNRCSKICVNII